MKGFEEQRAHHVRVLHERLPTEIEKVTWDLPRLWARRDDRLRRLIAHAKRHSSWHRGRLEDVDPASCSAEDLTHLPVMTKTDLMTHWDEIVTDRRLMLGRVEDHLREVVDHGLRYMLGEFIALTSAGSSGKRAVVVRDFDGLLEAALANIRNVEWLKRRRGVPPGTPDRQARLFSYSPVHITSVIGRVFERQQRQTLTLPPSLQDSELVEALVAFRPTRIIGYPSVLHRAALALKDRGARLGCWDVAANGEVLLSEARDAIEDAFGVPVRNVYGTTETGTIAESHPPHRQLQLIEDAVVFEAVDDEYRPVAPGVLSSGTLVTNVVNLVLPLIRYELDDQVAILDIAPPGEATGRVLAEVAGRRCESFRYPGGVLVDASVFRSVLAGEPLVVEYKVRQEPAGATVDVVARRNFVAASVEHRLAAALEMAGLANPRVRVMRVDSIGRDGPMQKLRRFVPMDADTPSESG